MVTFVAKFYSAHLLENGKKRPIYTSVNEVRKSSESVLDYWNGVTRKLARNMYDEVTEICDSQVVIPYSCSYGDCSGYISRG